MSYRNKGRGRLRSRRFRRYRSPNNNRGDRSNSRDSGRIIDERIDRIWDVLRETRRMLHEIDERLAKVEEYLYRREHKEKAGS